VTKKKLTNSDVNDKQAKTRLEQTINNLEAALRREKTILAREQKASEKVYENS
jgi:hypothetical protein